MDDADVRQHGAFRSARRARRVQDECSILIIDFVMSELEPRGSSSFANGSAPSIGSPTQNRYRSPGTAGGGAVHSCGKFGLKNDGYNAAIVEEILKLRAASAECR